MHVNCIEVMHATRQFRLEPGSLNENWQLNLVQQPQTASQASPSHAFYQCSHSTLQTAQSLPVAFIPDLKMLSCMRPVVGCGVAVGHPHEAFAPEDSLDGAAVCGWRFALQGFISRHRQPPQHHLSQPAISDKTAEDIYDACHGQRLCRRYCSTVRTLRDILAVMLQC